MGGWLAANVAVDHTERVTRLVLAAPLGLKVDEHPTTDIFSIPGEEVLGYLTADMSVFEGHVPTPPTPEFLADRYRETTSAARLLWARPYDLKLHRWLHRLTMPTLILWGDADRLIPHEQAPLWAELIPGADGKLLPGVGRLIFDESREAVDAIGAFVGEESPSERSGGRPVPAGRPPLRPLCPREHLCAGAVREGTVHAPWARSVTVSSRCNRSSGASRSSRSSRASARR